MRWFFGSKPGPASAPIAPPRPLIDDAFWFELSKELVQGADKARNEAASKLQTTVGWFWTVYTAAAVAGVALTDKDLPGWSIALIVLPVPALLCGYWLAGWTQVPVDIKFDPRMPDVIMEAHQHAGKVKRHRLIAATIVSGVAAALVAVAVVAAALAEPASSDNGFSASFDRDALKTQIALGGSFPPGGKVVITVTPAGGTLRRYVYVTKDGDLDKTFAVVVAASYEVAASWTEEKVGQYTLTKTVEGEKPSTADQSG